MRDQQPHTPNERFDENQRTALIYAYGEQVERTHRAMLERLYGDSASDPQLERETQSVRIRAVDRVSQWLDDQKAAAKLEALREFTQHFKDTFGESQWEYTGYLDGQIRELEGKLND